MLPSRSPPRTSRAAVDSIAFRKAKNISASVRAWRPTQILTLNWCDDLHPFGAAQRRRFDPHLHRVGVPSPHRAHARGLARRADHAPERILSRHGRPRGNRLNKDTGQTPRLTRVSSFLSPQGNWIAMTSANVSYGCDPRMRCPFRSNVGRCVTPESRRVASSSASKLRISSPS